MKKLVGYESIERDFSVELFRCEDKKVPYVHKLLINSNSEDICITSNSNELFEICGQLFETLKSCGKIIGVKIKELVLSENQIKKIEFSSCSSKVVVIKNDGTVIETDTNIAIFDTVCFSEDNYKKDVQILRELIDRLYERAAA